MGAKFKHMKPPTDEEEAQIQKQIASDPDSPEATDEQIARAKPFAEASCREHQTVPRSAAYRISERGRYPAYRSKYGRAVQGRRTGLARQDGGNTGQSGIISRKPIAERSTGAGCPVMLLEV